MFWRRYLAGRWPLLVWARSEREADVTAVIHSLCLDVADRR